MPTGAGVKLAIGVHCNVPPPSAKDAPHAVGQAGGVLPLVPDLVHMNVIPPVPGAVPEGGTMVAPTGYVVLGNQVTACIWP